MLYQVNSTPGRRVERRPSASSEQAFSAAALKGRSFSCAVTGLLHPEPASANWTTNLPPAEAGFEEQIKDLRRWPEGQLYLTSVPISA